MVEFPFSALDFSAELYYSGAWHDIGTQYLRQQEQDVFCRIERGTPDEGSGLKPSTCRLQLLNTDGRFSPRNPLSPLYGLIGRNTPLRCGVKIGDRRLVDDGTGSISTPDGAAVSITGDIDIRAEMTLRNWAQSTFLVTKGFTSGVNQKSYALGVDDSGHPALYWSTTGANTLTATCAQVVPRPLTGRRALRATLDVDNGAAGRTVTFYTSDDFSTWTQLGDPVVQAGTTSIFDGDQPLYFYANSGGEYHKAEVRNGIGGTAVANPDLSLVAENAASFADAAGRTWTVNAGAKVTNYRQRFIGEVTDWPVSWEAGGHDVTVTITASGLSRRLNQGAQPLRGSYYRGLTSTVAPIANIIGYWPFEDGQHSSVVASALSGVGPARVVGSPNFAADSESFACSGALPQLTTGAAFAGTLPNHTATSAIQVFLLVAVPAGGVASPQRIVAFRTNGNAYRLDVELQTNGSLTCHGYLPDNSVAFTLGPTGFAVNGTAFRLGLQVEDSGSDVVVTLSTLEPGDSVGEFTSATWSSVQAPRATDWVIAPDGGMDGCTIGHLSFQNVVDTIWAFSALLSAYDPEPAGRRIERLCGEEGIAFAGFGDLDDSELLGPQRSGVTLPELLAAAAEADSGQMLELRDSPTASLAYRNRVSLYRARRTVWVGYADPNGLVAGELVPLTDDATLRNDVTVSRDNGSSFRLEQDSGPLSVATVGRYLESVQLNVHGDTQLPDLAGWRLHLGSALDEPRWPTVTWDLSRAGEAGAENLAELVALDLGQKIVVDSLPTYLPADGVNALAVQLVEVLGPWCWDVVATTVPAKVFNVAVFGQEDSRYSGVGTVLSGSLTTTATSVGITCPHDVRWGHNDGDFIVLIGGEAMQVTVVTGSTVSQTLTVVRSINGVVKAHSAGESVELYYPAYYG